MVSCAIRARLVKKGARGTAGASEWRALWSCAWHTAFRLASQRGATGRMISQRLRALTTLTALAMAVPTGSLPAAASSPGGGGDRRPSSSADQAAPVKLIIDTDMGSDVSNLISVCSVNAMMDRGEANILATIHDASYASASEWHRYEDCGHRLRLAYFHGVFTISHQNLLPGFHVYFAIRRSSGKCSGRC